MSSVQKVLAVGVLVASFTFSVAFSESDRRFHSLIYDDPALVWDEAFPLGNGLLGALVWGDGKPLKISLDRTDLWDLRPVPEFHSDEYSYELMRQWVRDGRIEDLRRVYEAPYNRPAPTKIPAGRIEIDLGADVGFHQAVLSVGDGVANVYFQNGALARVWVDAENTVGRIRIEGSKNLHAEVVAPAFGGSDQTEDRPAISMGELGRLGYSAPKTMEESAFSGFLQEGWGEFRFAVALVWEEDGGAWRGAWSIATSEESDDPLSLAQKRAAAALKEEDEASLARQTEWWKNYWDKGWITVPNETLQNQWQLEMYKFGAAARPDTPPITLQGPWTADNGQLPPWKGDYHHDLNTELSYWPCYSGNRLEEGLGFLNWLWATRENCIDWTKRFYGLPGMNVPMTADLLNRQIGGWHQYTHSATTASWLAHHFYQHWRYSMDREFLEGRAFPYLRDVSVFLESLLVEDDRGRLTLELSSSPEIHDNRLEAWFKSITNYDLALIAWTFDKTAELAEELGRMEEAEHWRGVREKLPELAVAEDGFLLVSQTEPLHESHRHHSHLMAIHPLGLIQWERGGEDRRIVEATLAEMERLGSSMWTGYSFSWAGSLWARAKQGEKAERALEIFSKAFCLRNSFHCNGDQSGEGYSNFTYRPFTLEGNFAMAAGLQEMLIQSHADSIEVFPAVPSSWQSASFEKLRTEGAFVFSATRKDGAVSEVRIESEKGGVCRLKNPFAEAEFEVVGGAPTTVQTVGEDLVFKTDAGQVVQLIRRSRS